MGNKTSHPLLVASCEWFPFSCGLVIMRHEQYLPPQCSCFTVDPRSSVVGGSLQTEDDIKYGGG